MTEQFTTLPYYVWLTQEAGSPFIGNLSETIDEDDAPIHLFAPVIGFHKATPSEYAQFIHPLTGELTHAGKNLGSFITFNGVINDITAKQIMTMLNSVDDNTQSDDLFDTF